MFPKPLQQFFNRQNARLTLILLAIASFGLVVKNVSLDESELVIECVAENLREEDFYISPFLQLWKENP